VTNEINSGFRDAAKVGVTVRIRKCRSPFSTGTAGPAQIPDVLLAEWSFFDLL